MCPAGPPVLGGRLRVALSRLETVLLADLFEHGPCVNALASFGRIPSAEDCALLPFRQLLAIFVVGSSATERLSVRLKNVVLLDAR